MRLREVSVRDWRNARAVELTLGAPLTVLWGENGAGKTNLLEALAVLATWRSFRAVPWEQVVRHGQAAAAVAGRSESALGSARIGLTLTAGAGGRLERQARLDGEPVREPGLFFARIRAVTFTPDDVQIVRGAPELRRRFLDRAAFNAAPAHLDRVRAFRRIQAQKAALLRSGRAREREIDAWDERLAEAGAELTRGRRWLVDALEGPLVALHRTLAGVAVQARYRSAIAGEEADPAALRERYLRLLFDARAEELRRGLNLVGPQRDDLELVLEEAGGGFLPARSFGSQGQVRTLALALKLAELQVAGAGGDPPLLLVDDLSSELDAGRLGRLVALIEALESQVVVTSTLHEPILACSRRGGQAVGIRAGTVASVVPEG